jgi:peptide/nickel transport system permease protein
MRNPISKWADEHRYKIQDLKFTIHLWRKSRLSLIGSGIAVAWMAVALLAPSISPYDPFQLDVQNRLLPPSTEHLCGTDHLGRDILSRIIYGSRISLSIAVMVVVISIGIGTIFGLTSGYFGGKIDEILMRVTDMFFAFPRLILAMAVAAALGPGINNTMLAISVVSWPIYARLARAGALQIKEEIYVEAAKAVGASHFRVMFLHILPMVLSPLIVQATLDMGQVILTSAGLSFIGLGAQPPSPEWGLMVSEGRSYISGSWWVSTLPGIAIITTSLGFNLLGDGLRDILDVRARR